MIVLKKVRCSIGALACLAFLVPQGVLAATAATPGLVVEEVSQGTVGQKAGLLPGDVLVSWQRGPAAAEALPAAGELALPFDLAEVFLEQVPRAEVTLRGRRGAEEWSWVLPAGAPSVWMRTAPVLSGDLLGSYREAKARFETPAGLEAGAAALRGAAARARSGGAEGLAVWFLARAAGELAQGGRWEDADAFYNEALALEASRAPAVSAQLYREWAGFFHQRFNFDRATECYERALAADRRKGFGSLTEAWSVAGLALMDVRGGGSRDEAALYRQSIEIRHRLAPGSAEDARGWLLWGHAEALSERWGPAAERYRRAVAILAEQEAAHLLLVDTLRNLARVLGNLGEAENARQTWQRAHFLLLEEAPEDPMMASIIQGLGLVAAGQGELGRAEELLVRSIELCRRHWPGSLVEADCLLELGLLQERAGKQEAASRNLCQAADVVADWRDRLRDNEELRSRWGRFFAQYHRDCADSLVELGRGEEAFAAIEKGRARAYLDLRSERGVRFAALSSARAQEWHKLNAEYERAQEELGRAGARPGTPLEQIVNLEGRLREVRRKKERLLERDLPPGSVRYLEPLGLAEARRRLEPGTALLLYSTGRTKTRLFVLSPAGTSPEKGAPGWVVLPVQIGSAELKKKVERFRDTLVKDRSNRRAVQAQAKALYELLVAPAEPYLTGAERLVLSPDGPLHTLPFAALMRGDQYLIEWKPLHFTLSATVYADQLAHRPAGAPRPGPAKLVAFGDPRYLPAAVASADLRGIPGQGVAPLPASRQEVEGLADLFPGARTVLGDQVTEETVLGAVQGASLVHFAVHGLVTERFPLNSGLVLSPSRKPGEEGRNGLLQAWEVMESLPLDADLVTLSACDTALGGEVGGEGLVGLTRAFQYAGARSVIATLWGISDRSTAGFMKELYGALKEGKTKDEALRAAQIAQIRSDKPQPFYWAAFQLFGDWR